MGLIQNARWRFQCPECGLGDSEVGHMTQPDTIFCVVCLEEVGRQVRLHVWEDVFTDQVHLPDGLDAAA